MSVPKRRQTKSRRDRRRQHHKLTSQNTHLCSQCKKPKMSHRVCPECGFYNGREVIDTMKKEEKKKKKEKAKQK